MSFNAYAAAALALALIGAARAHSHARPDDPNVQTAPAPRSSAYEQYRPLTDEPSASWREINDEVARVGGHAGVLRAVEKGAPADSAGAQRKAPHASRHDGELK